MVIASSSSVSPQQSKELCATHVFTRVDSKSKETKTKQNQELLSSQEQRNTTKRKNTEKLPERLKQKIYTEIWSLKKKEKQPIINLSFWVLNETEERDRFIVLCHMLI